MLFDLCVGMRLYMSVSLCLCIQYLQEEKVLVFPASTLIVYLLQTHVALLKSQAA